MSSRLCREQPHGESHEKAMRNGDKKDHSETQLKSPLQLSLHREVQRVLEKSLQQKQQIHCLRYVCVCIIYVYVIYMCVYFWEKFSKMMEGVNDLRRVLVYGQ